MTQEKDKTKPPTQTICAGGRIAYDFPIRYAPNRVVRFEDLTSWSSIPEGHIYLFEQAQKIIFCEQTNIFT